MSGGRVEGCSKEPVCVTAGRAKFFSGEHKVNMSDIHCVTDKIRNTSLVSNRQIATTFGTIGWEVLIHPPLCVREDSISTVLHLRGSGAETPIKTFSLAGLRLHR